MWKFIGLEKTYLFLEERWVKNSNFVSSNVYANAPDHRRILHGGHPLHPISNELQKNQPNKQTQLRKTISKALLFCPLFSHHCKTVIKADQKTSFYPSINDILYQKYLKKRQCHCDNVALCEATKSKCVCRILKYIRSVVLLLAFPVYIRLVVKQVVNNDFFASQPCTAECTARFSQRLYSESSQTCICWMDCIDWWIISILDTRLCLTCSTVLYSGWCIIIFGLKVDVRLS